MKTFSAKKVKKALGKIFIFSVLAILILCLVGLINLMMIPFQVAIACCIYFIWNGLATFTGHLLPEVTPVTSYIIGSLLAVAGSLYNVIKPKDKKEE